jgi:hypothetical protein
MIKSFLPILILLLFNVHAQANLLLPITPKRINIKENILTIETIIKNNHNGFYSSYRKSLILENNFQFGSNAVTNQMALNLYNNSFITSAMKNNVSKQLKSTNRVGFLNETNLTYYNFTNNDTLFILGNANWYAKVGNITWVDSKFTADGFNLVFNGNLPFAGKEAVLDGTKLKQLAYNKLVFGFTKQLNKKPITIGAEIQLLQGYNYLSINLPSAKLYTDSLAEYIDAKYNASISTLNNSKPKLLKPQGYGVGAGFNIGAALGSGWMVSLKAQNFGIIYFKKSIKTYTSDTSLIFEGYELNNLFAGSAVTSSIQPAPVDSVLAVLQPSITYPSTKAYTPGMLQLNFNKIMSAKKSLEIGAAYLVNSSALPYFYTTFNKYNNFINYSASIAYGGYGTWHAGVGIGIIFNKVGIQFATQDLQAVLFKKVGALSATLKVGYFF